MFSGLFLALVVGCRKEPRSVDPATEGPDPAPIKTGVAAKKEDGRKPKDNGKKPKEEEKKPKHGNIVVLTPRAAAKLHEFMKTMKGPHFLRVRVVDGEYKLDLDPETDATQDRFGESRGIRIVVDRESSLALLPGTIVDFIDEGEVKGFKVSPPEIAKGPPDTSLSLPQARRGFKTTLLRRKSTGTPPPKPPVGVLRLIRYDAPVGKLAAYLTADPKDGKKHPAIVWITGGDCNSIDQGCWREGPLQNDQSASAFRKAGIVMMFPSLRGGNNNPGPKEGFFGEVDDVLASLEFLRKQPFVDPDRIYLGGHSTGGTLVLLVAECTNRFRAVFSFGPVHDVLNYGPGYNPFALSDAKEVRLRAPGLWLHSVRSPTFVFEGTIGGNVESLRSMARVSKNPKVRFLEVKGANHFNLLAPTNRLLAERVLRDTGSACNLDFTEEEVSKPFRK
jgi:Fe-S cluster assembly iron-binding protein IscA/alpha/beta superfamily hydrolase